MIRIGSDPSISWAPRPTAHASSPAIDAGVRLFRWKEKKNYKSILQKKKKKKVWAVGPDMDLGLVDWALGPTRCLKENCSTY